MYKHRVTIVMGPSTKYSFTAMMSSSEMVDFRKWLGGGMEGSFTIEPMTFHHENLNMNVAGREYILTDPRNILFVDHETLRDVSS